MLKKQQKNCLTNQEGATPLFFVCRKENGMQKDTIEKVKNDIIAFDWTCYKKGTFYQTVRYLRERLMKIPHRKCDENYCYLEYIAESRCAFRRKDFRQAMSSLVSVISLAEWSFSSKSAILTLLDDYLEKERVCIED